MTDFDQSNFQDTKPRPGENPGVLNIMNCKHKLSISIEYLKECFALKNNGVLVWKERPDYHFSCRAKAISTNKQRSGKIAGIIGKDGYVIVRVANRLYPAHIIVFAMHHGFFPDREIDHKDRNKLNNSPDNLRLAYRYQNMANMSAHKDNKLGLKGVCEHKPGIYRSRIRHNGKNIHLGLFNNPESAHQAYRKAELELRGEFAS